MAGTKFAGQASGLRPLSPQLIIMYTPCTCPGCRQDHPGFAAFAQCSCPHSFTTMLVHNGCSFETSITPRPCPGCRQVARSDRHIPVLVAHNGCGFDFPFLVKEYRRVGLEVPLQWPYLDTVQLARHFRGMRKNGLVSNSVMRDATHVVPD